jgi:integrase
MGESTKPFDRWHVTRKPRPGAAPCKCGTKNAPLYPSGEHGRGQRWQARYTDPEGRRHKPGFDSYREAQSHLDEVALMIRANTWVDPEVGKKTVAFYAAQMIERRRARNMDEGTSSTYESHLRNHILPFAGKRESQTLKRRDTAALVDHLIKKLDSSAYVVGVFKTWRILVNYMIDEDVPLAANVCARIQLPVVEDRVEVAFSPQQVVRLAEAMRQVEPRFEILIWIAACAGLREGEAFGLRWEDVGWEESLLFVVEQRQRGKAKKLKTDSSKVTLPVDRFLIDRLSEHVARHPRNATVTDRSLRRRRQTGYTPPPDEGLITTNRYGRPVQRSDFNKKWNAAKDIAWADTSLGWPEKKEARFHDLKRFYTSRLGSSGHHDPKTTQALSRHSTFSLTWDTYARPPRAVEGVTVRTFSDSFAPLTELQKRVQAEPEDPQRWDEAG